jgi:pyruvate dehydrogenase E1 component beta subunit
LNLGEAFDHLDAPLVRITGADIPMPYAQNLEVASLPTVELIQQTILKNLE